MHSRIPPAILLVPLFALGAGGPAAASIETVLFEGTVVSVGAPLGSTVVVGDRLRITFSYDTSTPEVGSPGNCCSAFAGALTSVSVVALHGGSPVYTASLSSSAATQANLNQLGSTDQFALYANSGSMAGAPLGGLGIAGASAVTYWPGGHFPTADVLPAASLLSNLALLSSPSLKVAFGPGAGTYFITAGIDTITVVPEPTALVLVATGLVPIALARARRHRAR